jgi:2-oxoglutarate-dependent dioxygenase
MPPITDSIVRPLQLVDNEVRFYKEEGYLLLPGLLSEQNALAIAQEVIDIVVKVMGVAPEQLNRAREDQDKLRQTTQYLAGSKLDAMVNSPSLRSIAGRLMGGDSTLYMPFTALKSGGGGGRFHFHQDNQYTRYSDGMHGINIWFALGEMTPENGCLQIVPRSHRKGTLEKGAGGDPASPIKTDPSDFLAVPSNFLPVRMRAGDAVAFSRLTVHGSGPNTTNAPRVGYATQFFRNDAMATWDNQPPRPLKGANRFPTAPVHHIGPVEAKSLDGH